VSFWNVVQPTVWAPGTCDRSGYDCECDDPDYGPRIRQVRDTAEHFSVEVSVVQPGFMAVTCRCGWRNLAINWDEHLSVAAPLRTVIE
jgi:hypothetical protein